MPENVQLSEAQIIEMRGQLRCDLCDECFTCGPHEEIGEFAAPMGVHCTGQPEYESVIAHAQCGLGAGYEIA